MRYLLNQNAGAIGKDGYHCRIRITLICLTTAVICRLVFNQFGISPATNEWFSWVGAWIQVHWNFHFLYLSCSFSLASLMNNSIYITREIISWNSNQYSINKLFGSHFHGTMDIRTRNSSSEKFSQIIFLKWNVYQIVFFTICSWMWIFFVFTTNYPNQLINVHGPVLRWTILYY